MSTSFRYRPYSSILPSSYLYRQLGHFDWGQSRVSIGWNTAVVESIQVERARTVARIQPGAGVGIRKGGKQPSGLVHGTGSYEHFNTSQRLCVLGWI